MIWVPWVVMVALSLWIYTRYAAVVDESGARWLEIQQAKELIERMANTTSDQEPTRRDANDPLRDRFVFCDRWVERGHASTCPWQALLQWSR